MKDLLRSGQHSLYIKREGHLLFNESKDHILLVEGGEQSLFNYFQWEAITFIYEVTFQGGYHHLLQGSYGVLMT